jgi:hypothetical protein
MPALPVEQKRFESADWKRIVFALADYAYRAMGPDTTWAEVSRIVRTAIRLALSEKTETWDPTEETLIRHLGRNLREVVIVARDLRGDGVEAREESPDWSIGERTYAIAEMRKHIPSAVGLPISNDAYFRARRRFRTTVVDIYRKKRRELGHTES